MDIPRTTSNPTGERVLKHVGIITFHFTNNYGAVLQCYALKKKLSALGFCVAVIDYRPSYHAVKYSAWKNPFIFARTSLARTISRKEQDINMLSCIRLWLRAFARALLANMLGTDRKEANVFRHFVSRNLHVTRRYPTLLSLRKNPPKLDAYICGSDQLWNPDLLDGHFDPAYFLDFGSDKIRRVAYAISMKETLTAAQTIQLGCLCRRLNAIALREENRAINTTLGRTAYISVDPSLLIDAHDYESIEAAAPSEEPYIFVYGLETTNEMQGAVAAVAASLRLPVINGSPARVKLTVPAKSVRDYAPGEFLAYIKHAAFVVTNSFHGTAFSIIYEKQFFSVPHSTRGNRMTELLQQIGLDERLLQGQPICAQNCLARIAYDHVQKKLAQLREESSNYLLNSLDVTKQSAC